MHSCTNYNMNARDEMNKCISDIARMMRRPWPHVGRDLKKHVPTGYVYVLQERNSNNIFIGWGGRTTLKDTLTRIQMGNPRNLIVIKVLLRDNIHDTALIYKIICDGLILHHTRGRWYHIENIERVIGGLESFDNMNIYVPGVTSL